ncbi:MULTISPECIES: DUF3530 family protein [unclassified Oleiphilus]|nr:MULTISPECIES: DUF3530 family protein [unclassified Oleiphilus]KZY64866.1 hypothetical protein A3738_09765 [Oleiphilus sp. HI0066]KZY71497.1 hypothetical protein A3739_04670 [Oleiphilus sp. HI0067]
MYAINHKITSKILSNLRIISLSLIVSANTLAQETSSGLAQSNENTSQEAPEQAPSAEEMRPTLPALIQQERAFTKLLAAASPENQVTWLDIKYPGSASSHQSLALNIKPKSPITQGAALIIPNTSQHADWPNIVRSLREYLPFTGWQTLSISLPTFELSSTPQRELETKSFDSFPANEAITKATLLGSRAQKAPEAESPSTEDAEAEPAAEPEESESVDINLKEDEELSTKIGPYHDRAIVHIQAGMNSLASQGFQNIALIAIGESAGLAIDFIQSKESEISDKGFALIFIAPELNQHQNIELSSELGAGFPAPILDIYESSPEAKDKARLRNAGARVGGFANYRQLKLSAPKGSGSEGFLEKRISDWLNRYSPGQEQASAR